MQAQNFHLQIRSKAAAAVHRKTSPLCHVARSTISQQHKQHRPQAASQAVETLQEHDVVALTNADGSVDYCQVLQGCSESQQRCQLLWKGQVLQMTADAQLESLGGYPAADSLTVTSFPQLGQVLTAMQQREGAPPPTVSSSIQVVDSLSNLQSQVQADAAYWCDGTAPGDPIKTELQQAVFTAGELLALAAGQRGIVLVQLFNGWDPSKGQPLYNPLVITVLEQVLAAPGVASCSSVAPGGVGLTGILYADREPFASWAQHLASFGCQANTVAGSSYYKLLIGQLLGYKLENVLAYVAASGEPASEELQKQVSQDIRKLSKVKPKLPWSASDTNIKRAKPAKAAGGKKAGGGGGFGAK